MKITIFDGFFKNKEKTGYKLMRDYKKLNRKLKIYAKDYDSFGFVPYNVGKELEETCDFDNNFIGIHRTGYSNAEYIIDDVFNRGLINNGDVMQGGISSYVDIGKTVSQATDMTFLVGMLKTACNYKMSQGAFLIKIPKDYVFHGEKPIYSKENDIMRLLPEFVYGYISVDENNTVGEIVKNPNYKDEHDYQDEGLFYEGQNVRAR